ncbi:MAG: CPBP family intramembrane glutamic endopeptidase [Polyangiaceae bacterium]
MTPPPVPRDVPLDARPSSPFATRIGRWLVGMAELALVAWVGKALFRAFEPFGGSWAESVFRARGSVRYPQETPAYVVPFLLQMLVLFPAVRWARGGRSRASFGLARPFAGASACLAMTLAGLVVMNVGTLAVPGVLDAAWTAYGMSGPTDAWVFVLWMSPVVAAFGEEVTFRSCLQGGLMEASVPVGALSSAITFASLHAFQGLVPLFAFHVPAAVLYAGIYARHRDLVSQMVAHAAYDAIVFGEMWLLYRGGVDRTAMTVGVTVAATVGLVLQRKTFGTIVADGRALFRGAFRDPSMLAVAVPSVALLAWFLRT